MSVETALWPLHATCKNALRHARRWTLHGVARVELGGRDFWPPGCGPGSPAEGRSAMGGHCRPTPGDTVLSYWEFTLGVGQARRSASRASP